MTVTSKAEVEECKDQTCLGLRVSLGSALDLTRCHLKLNSKTRAGGAGHWLSICETLGSTLSITNKVKPQIISRSLISTQLFLGFDLPKKTFQFAMFVLPGNYKEMKMYFPVLMAKVQVHKM